MMKAILSGLWATFRTLLASRAALMIENLALRQQLADFQRQKSKPRLLPRDRAFWILMRRLWSKWASCLLFVDPGTAVVSDECGDGDQPNGERADLASPRQSAI
ncbi:MAG: hypothetical protein IT581_11035 [Verrucomicrobiales bacterium]|nr:hypothetical protein [Verrucomicrobiales bacterium]